tara:strand:+ start:414 stop:593 length:180 start_codon:yes stop_codon:yes gene_type:complete
MELKPLWVSDWQNRASFLVPDNRIPVTLKAEDQGKDFLFESSKTYKLTKNGSGWKVDRT